jgi:hypothetical protein
MTEDRRAILLPAGGAILAIMLAAAIGVVLAMLVPT